MSGEIPNFVEKVTKREESPDAEMRALQGRAGDLMLSTLSSTRRKAAQQTFMDGRMKAGRASRRGLTSVWDAHDSQAEQEAQHPPPCSSGVMGAVWAQRK